MLEAGAGPASDNRFDSEREGVGLSAEYSED